MSGELIMKALTDIDDKFIAEAADERYVRSVFSDADREELASHKPKSVKTKISRILLVAIISILLLAIACIAISGTFFNFNFPENVVSVVGDVAELDLLNEPGTAENYNDDCYEVVKELHDLGIDNVALPAALLEEWTQSEEIQCQYGDDILISSDFAFEKDSMIVSVQVVRYFDEAYIPETEIMMVEKGEKIDVNGLSVYVFYQGAGIITVEYIDGLTVHSLCFSWCYYDEVIEIIKTIGVSAQ